MTEKVYCVNCKEMFPMDEGESIGEIGDGQVICKDCHKLLTAIQKELSTNFDLTLEQITTIKNQKELLKELLDKDKTVEFMCEMKFTGGIFHHNLDDAPVVLDDMFYIRELYMEELTWTPEWQSA